MTASRLPAVGLVEFAGGVGVDRTTAQGWLRAGLPAKHRHGRRGAHVIEVWPAVRWLRQHDAEVCAERVAAAKSSPAAEQARLVKLQSDARLAQLSVAEREGQVVTADQVQDRWGRMATAMRERVLALPAVAVQKGLLAPEHEGALADLVAEALHELATRGTAA